MLFVSGRKKAYESLADDLYKLYVPTSKRKSTYPIKLFVPSLFHVLMPFRS